MTTIQQNYPLLERGTKIYFTGYMIDNVLSVLKENLNSYFKLQANIDDNKVTYLDGANVGNEYISFVNNAVTPLLINIQEERILRDSNPFNKKVENGVRVGRHREIRLDLLVLFVARFSDYEQGLKYISLIIKYFQGNPVLDHSNTPNLEPDIDQLFVSLQTMPIQEQNEIWNALRSSYLPSVAYKVGVVVFEEEDTIVPKSEILSVEIELENKNQGA